jgi:DNA-binding NarL/FixJ family response regulator
VSDIRVILSQMPPMLRDILHDALQAEPMIRIVGEVEQNADAAEAAAREGAHVVVTGEFRKDDRVSCRLLVVHRASGAAGQRSGTGHGIELHEKPLGDVSPGELVEAIRHAVTERREENPWRHW